MTDLNNETNKRFQICIDIESMEEMWGSQCPNMVLADSILSLADSMDGMVTSNLYTETEVYAWVHEEFEKIGCAGQVYFRVDDLDEEVA
ncbi:hypothetical protein OAN06_02905 [Hellea sp.]|nr:hypothetical protein [Hellea sp.]